MKYIKKYNKNEDFSKVLTKNDIKNIFQELSDEGCTLNIRENKVNLVHRLIISIIFEDNLFSDNTPGFINPKYNLDLLEKASNMLIIVIHCLKRISNYDILYGVRDNMITIELSNNFDIPDSFFYV